MLATDRAHFSRCNPYMDSPQSIGTSAHHLHALRCRLWEELTKLSLWPKGYQATISAPHMVWRQNTPGHRCILWITAVLFLVVKLSSLRPPSTPTPWSFYTTSCMTEPKLWTWAPAAESCPPALHEWWATRAGKHIQSPFGGILMDLN